MGVGELYEYCPVYDYSIKMQMNDTDPGRGFTWGRESYATIAALNYTSGDMQIAGSLRAAGHLFTSYNGNNILLRSADNGGDAGILVQNSGGSFKFQIYGNGTDYGFLNANWASWDIRKTIGGVMYMNGDNSYYLQTNSTSNFYALNIQGNAVVHAGNIGSQSVSYAATSGSSGSVTGLTLTSSANGINPDNVTQNQIGYNTSVSLFGQTDGGLYSSAYSSSWIHQIYGDFRTGQIAIRGKNSGSWQAWRVVLDSSNYTSYAPSLTGSGASGSWEISVTGSAGSVAWTNVSSRPTALSQFTNDLGNYGGWITSSGSISGNAATATSATQVVTIQDSAPDGAAGKLWWESDTGKLKVYYDSTWIDATPVPDTALFYAKAGGAITGDVTIQQTLTVVGNTLIQGTLTETSDISLKENILPLERSLAKVMKLTGVSFNKKTTPHIKEIGFIAQEVEEIIPDLVTETNDGIKTVSYSRVSAILVETVKEQQAQIDELKEMVNILTKKLNNQ